MEVVCSIPTMSRRRGQRRTWNSSVLSSAVAATPGMICHLEGALPRTNVRGGRLRNLSCDAKISRCARNDMGKDTKSQGEDAQNDMGNSRQCQQACTMAPDLPNRSKPQAKSITTPCVFCNFQGLSLDDESERQRPPCHFEGALPRTNVRGGRLRNLSYEVKISRCARNDRKESARRCDAARKTAGRTAV